MRTDLAFDVMAKILPDVVEILSDPATKNAFDGDDVTVISGMGALMPALVVNHREAMLRIIGAISGKDADTVAAQDWATETLTQWLDAKKFIDELLVFSLPWVRLARKA